MANYKDLKHQNIVDKGTEGIAIPIGTTGQRGSTQGQLRYNTTLGLAEYYDGASFRNIDIDPIITSVTANTVADDDISSSPSRVIAGSNFSESATVKLIGADDTEYTPASTTVNSSSQITITLPSNITEANDPYDIKVTNISGLSGTGLNLFNVDAEPAFTTGAGSIGTLTDDSRAGSGLTTVAGTWADGTPTFAVTSGSIPAGLTFASNGSWSGTATQVATNTTSNFTVTITGGLSTATRAYSAIVNAPVVTFTTSAGTLGTIPDDDRTQGEYSLSTAAATATTGTVSYAIQSGAMPAGLSFNTSTAAFTGNATAQGSDTTTNFTIRATTTSQSIYADRAFSILVTDPVLTYETADGKLGTITEATLGSYSLSAATATATSGTVSYALNSGAMPSGLSFNTSSAAITGTANSVGSNTTTTFTVRATTTSASEYLDREFSILVEAPPEPDVYYLVVAGGGAGGYSHGAGGGAGGYRTNYSGSTVELTVGATYTVTVGAGGRGGDAGDPTPTSGATSSFIGTGVSISSTGGGYGGNQQNGRKHGASGGSGGGGSMTTVDSGNAGSGNAGSYSPSEGNGGGTCNTNWGGGGGGGAGGSGGSGEGGAGGVGTSNSITRSAVYYAGGGGGGGDSGTFSGGNGGGGNGSTGAGTDGTDGLGGGGGGSRSGDSGSGGDGVVIIRMTTADYDGKIASQSNGTVATTGANTYITWTVNGNIVVNS